MEIYFSFSFFFLIYNRRKSESNVCSLLVSNEFVDDLALVSSKLIRFASLALAELANLRRIFVFVFFTLKAMISCSENRMARSLAAFQANPSTSSR